MPDMPAQSLLRVEALCASRVRRAPGPRQVKEIVFEAVSFSVAAGERLALVGKTALDLTTLLRTVARLLPSDAGAIYFDGEDVTHLSGGALRRLRQRLQYVGGDPRHVLPPDYTVIKVLLEPLQIHNLGTPAEQHARCEAAAEAMGIHRLLLDRNVSALSLALRLRVALARALTLHPRLLVCDGPIDWVDWAAARPLLESVDHACRAWREPAAWIWSTANRELAAAFADRVLYLADGRLEIDPE